MSGQAGFAGDGADPRLPGQQACHVADGPVIEVIDLDRARSPDHLRHIVVGSAWIGFAVRITPGSAPAAPVDLPRLGTGRNLALLGAEGGQDLCLLALGHLEVVHGVDKFLSDFVEHLG